MVSADMINMISLPFVPGVCEWITQRATGRPLVAVASAEGPEIYLYSINPEVVDDVPTPKHVVRVHSAPGDTTPRPRFAPDYKPPLPAAFSSCALASWRVCGWTHHQCA